EYFRTSRASTYVVDPPAPGDADDPGAERGRLVPFEPAEVPDHGYPGVGREILGGGHPRDRSEVFEHDRLGLPEECVEGELVTLLRAAQKVGELGGGHFAPSCNAHVVPDD